MLEQINGFSNVGLSVLFQAEGSKMFSVRDALNAIEHPISGKSCSLGVAVHQGTSLLTVPLCSLWTHSIFLFAVPNLVFPLNLKIF